ncbi:phosphoenolpyruvate--protein phosphotransferase [Rummeliibacillus sp. G93]|uniref:phosphoenolpyruvate--protein phosphotransferase n=1 Tax=Rummeliibacillus sp. G93 TaxID=2939494 RepID=UPI00201C42E7|nr:phosphoenolpyruvate--protein phosphotransferase [Rummeliibacillus sp. G93]UQW98564.1 phosphoenolpyruvate--protein phosphotransferase [Rummeliibacillus sp. G93]
MLEMKGIAVSNGIAIAKAYCLVEPDLSFEKVSIGDSEEEKKRLKNAVAEAKKDLEGIKAEAERKFGPDKAAIFQAHLLVLEDPEMLGMIDGKIDEGTNAEAALHEVSTTFIEMFEVMENAYMKERAADIRDVSKRLLSKLLNVEIPDYSHLNEDVIIIANDLTPSMTAQLDKTHVKGFVTDIGGRTSHSAILARTMEIPAVVGAKTATKDIQQGSLVIVDGSKGDVIVDAEPEIVGTYQTAQKAYLEERAYFEQFKGEPSISRDGHHVEIAGNIGKPEDADIVLENGGDGVGLFRTEFLYMDRTDLPSEEEQFLSYKSVLEKMKGKPTVVRTLDIGGDKKLPYLKMEEEMNPFLGHRAIRLCLDDTALFRTQLRALLRASIYGNLKIMFPMIATLDEFREAKAILEDVKKELVTEGKEVSDTIEVGMMVEIPSTAVMADLFAKEADFLSIGTNDLIQYTLAADRMNEKVSYLYQPYNPAILRLVKSVIDGAHKEGKWVGMCGEMAGDEIAIPILLAMGLDEFSMSASSILRARAQIAKSSKEDLEKHIEKILQLSSNKEVSSYVTQYLMKETK